jgi:hypothetical protein
MVLLDFSTKSLLFKNVILSVRSTKRWNQKMTIENVDVAKADANANLIADMDKDQASFMEARAEKRKAEEMEYS